MKHFQILTHPEITLIVLSFERMYDLDYNDTSVTLLYFHDEYT